MNEFEKNPQGPMASGSLLLEKDTTPITTAEGSRTYILETVHVNRVSIDIAASHACTVQLIRLPDGETEGEASLSASVTGGVPANHVYSDVLCQALKLVITNTSGSNMTSFSLYVRGGA